MIDVNHSEQQRELEWKKFNSLWDLWDYDKRSNICAMRVQKGNEKEGGAKKVSEETMAKNSPNLAKDTNLQIQKDEWTSNRINPKKSIPNTS